MARTVDIAGPRGEKLTQAYDKFGQPIGQPMNAFEAAQFLNLGDRQVAAVPRAGMSLPVGMSPSDKDASARGWASVNQGAQRLALDQQNAGAGKPPPGYRFKIDGALEAIPGGPADIKAGELGARQEKMKQGAIAQADRVVNKVDEALSKVGMTTTGLGSAMAAIPGTSARDLRSTLDTIKANLGFAELQAMRDASPTGGALGAIAVQELVALQSTVASLDQAQSQQQLAKSLEQIKTHYTNWKNTVQGGAQTGGATGGWSIKKVP